MNCKLLHSAKYAYVPPDGSATEEPVVLGGSVCCGSVSSDSKSLTENSVVGKYNVVTISTELQQDLEQLELTNTARFKTSVASSINCSKYV